MPLKSIPDPIERKIQVICSETGQSYADIFKMILWLGIAKYNEKKIDASIYQSQMPNTEIGN